MTTIFPDVLKAISHSLTAEQIPMYYTIVLLEDEDIEEKKGRKISECKLTGTALQTKDWHKAQADDQNICFIIDRLIAGQRPTKTDIERNNIDKRFLHHWENYKLKNGVLYRESTIDNQKIEQLCYHLH